jgi:6-pyruvoyltetrahydropterin/6-carboxytetrahydropterin synthase
MSHGRGASAPLTGRFRVTKTYGPEVGLSACFRQWRASSHCRFLHGYSLAFTLVFEADQLDERGWVIDFGSLKEIKEKLVGLFDHKTVIALDDPELKRFEALDLAGACDLKVLHAVGCEAFAAQTHRMVSIWLRDSGHGERVRLVSVECREHGANSALCMGEPP